MRHRGLVQVLAHELAPPHPCIVMEYLPGGTLAQRLAAAPLGRSGGLRRSSWAWRGVLEGRDVTFKVEGARVDVRAGQLRWAPTQGVPTELPAGATLDVP